MTTLVSAPLRSAAEAVVDLFKSGVLSGIVPDDDHLENGGYHCSVEDLRRFGNGDDYSNVRPDDKNRNVKHGAAFDVSVNEADMKRIHSRVHAVWADRSDPRRKYVNAINCWDGSGDAVRLDFYANTAGYASDDHKWHTHGEFRRRYVLDAKAARAVVSIYAGVSKAAWIEEEEDGMSVQDVVDGLSTAKPYEIQRIADRGWGNVSTRRMVEYMFEALVAAGMIDVDGDGQIDDSAAIPARLARIEAALARLEAPGGTQ